MMPEWAIQLLGIVGGCATVYAGIRADLAALHAKVDEAARAAREAHRRIDNIFSPN